MQYIRCSIQSFCIVGREKDRKIPLKTVLHTFCSVTHRVIGPNVNAPSFRSFVIDAGQIASVTSAVYNVVVFWINGDMGTFSTSGGFPITFAYVPAFSSVINSHGRIVLLRPINFIRKRIISGNAIKLCGRLISIGTPIFTPVIRNLCTPVITND